MADYLTKLAARALGVAAIAQPAVPSLFAPEPPRAPPAQDGEAGGPRPPVEAGLGPPAVLARSGQPGASATTSSLPQVAAQAKPFRDATTLAPPVQAGEAGGTGSPVEAGLGPPAVLARSGQPGASATTSSLPQVAAQAKPFRDATTLAPPARSGGSQTLTDLALPESWASERPHAAAGGDEPARTGVATPMAEPGDLVPSSQRTRVERPLAQARGQRPAEPAVSPASATSSPASLVPNYVQLNAEAAGAMPDSPAALHGDSPMVSPIELSAFKRQRAAGDDADRSAVAPTVAATTQPVTASATPQNAPDVVTADQVAPPAVLLLRQIDAATQASAPPAMVRPPWQDVEAGAAELGFPASGLLLPLESQQVSGKRPQVAAHVPAPGQTPPAPAPAPIVEVTIGRVEIRAVQAARPATRPKAAPSAPALSLEAYLSQQQGNKP